MSLRLGLILSLFPLHDESLSYSQWALGQHEIQVTFRIHLEDLKTLGDVDPDRNGFMDQEELDALLPALASYLKDKYQIFNDGGRCDAKLLEARLSRPIAVWAVRAQVIIRFTYSSAHPINRLRVLCEAFHDKEVLSAKHVLTLPNGEIFVFERGRSETSWPGPNFFILGLVAWFTGWAHWAFLIVILVAIPGSRNAAMCATAFALAAGGTLALTGSHQLSPTWRSVQFLLVGSLFYVSLENWMIRHTRWRWILALAFGMVHGMSLGLKVLMEAPTIHTSNLTAYSMGIEIALFATVAGIIPLLGWARRRHPTGTLKLISSFGILCSLLALTALF